jgi:hypothetical protein
MFLFIENKLNRKHVYIYTTIIELEANHNIEYLSYHLILN